MERLETILRELVVSEQGLNALFTVLKSSEEYYDAAGTEELNAAIIFTTSLQVRQINLKDITNRQVKLTMKMNRIIMIKTLERGI